MVRIEAKQVINLRTEVIRNTMMRVCRLLYPLIGATCIMSVCVRVCEYV
jgi:hypothetical protein